MNHNNRSASKNQNTHLIILSIAALAIVVGMVGLFFPQILMFSQKSSLASSSKFEQVANTVPSSPKPTTAPINEWKIYTDDQFGFTIKYPEPTIERYKNVIPIKQYLNDDLTSGYRLTLTPPLPSLSQSDYFLIIIKEVSTPISLIEQWKNSQSANGFSVVCNENTCIKSSSSSSKEFHYTFEESTLDGKHAVIINGTTSDYEQNTKPEVYQWIYIQPNNSYTVEVQKGNSEKVNQILSTLQFTK